MKQVQLNPGAQSRFVNSEARYAGYFGGLGSGKTFAGLVRVLKFAQQPKPPGMLYGARGVVVAVNFRVLEDVVLPEFWKLVDGTDLVKDWVKSKKKVILKNNAEILFRSLDRPNWMRGLDLSYFFIDEGRLTNLEAWKILVGRLRQHGYNHSGWVCSTTNGYDWMWSVFHEDSPERRTNAEWFGAPTHENQAHLPEEYIRELKAQYEGPFYDQEVLGKFVGVISGAVFPHWSMSVFMRDVPHDPTLPLLSFWDFGVGDLGVCLFAQLRDIEKQVDGQTLWVKELRFVDLIDHEDWSADDWAAAWHDTCNAHFDGRRPDQNWGDPAGMQRNMTTGTSVIDALTAAGVPVAPAPRKPVDFGATILDNMMAGGRVIADQVRCQKLGAAFAQHKWQTDPNTGLRVGTRPVHDWTSHYCDAARYGAQARLGHFPRRDSPPSPEKPGPGTIGHLHDQILNPPRDLFGRPIRRRPIFQLPVPLGE